MSEKADWRDVAWGAFFALLIAYIVVGAVVGVISSSRNVVVPDYGIDYPMDGLR